MTRGLVLAVAIATMHPAHADEPLRPERVPTKARELADQGRRQHDAGDYDAAIAAFKEAYVLAPSPMLLFNIAQAYRLAGACDDSAWMYRRFLDTGPHGAQRELAEAHLATVEKCGTGGLRVTAARPPVADATPSRRMPPVAVARRAETPRANAYKRAAVYTAVGGGVALIGATVFALDARAASNAVEAAYESGGKWKDVEATDRRGRRSERFATALGLGGGVALVSAAVLYGVGMHRESASHVAVSPTSRGGAQVSVSWDF